jgi:hypothetical protein
MVVDTLPAKYEWKRLSWSHIVGGAALFAVLYWVAGWLPGEESGSLSVLPAITICFCRPGTRREWVLATGAALAVAVAQLAGHLLGYAVTGTWPPHNLDAMSDAEHTVIGLGFVTGIPAAVSLVGVLGRRRVEATGDAELTTADLSPLQHGILVAVATILLSGIILAGRAIPPGVGMSSALTVFAVMPSGVVAVLAWRNARPRKPLLLARFGLSVLIAFASSYGVYLAIEDGTYSVSPGVALLLVLIVPFLAAPLIGWWQMTRFARKHGMLSLTSPPDAKADP